MSGGRALVWAQREELGAGSVYVFERDAGTETWTEQTRLVSAGGSPAAVVGARVACTGGIAAVFPCNNADLLTYLPVSNIGGAGSLNDIWDWTDPQTGREYALVGRNDGRAFVDVSNPVDPIFLGVLPTHSVNSGWRDIKTYAGHAFIVSEAPVHGMQVFDLTQLRAVQNPPTTFAETAHYDNVNSAHNIAINEETGYAYIVGANGGRQTCSGGLHMVDICSNSSQTTIVTKKRAKRGDGLRLYAVDACYLFEKKPILTCCLSHRNKAVILCGVGYTLLPWGYGWRAGRWGPTASRPRR